MKQAFVDKTVTVAVRDTEVPAPQPGQVLIRVVVSGTNPKDWKVARWRPESPPLNQGDDIAGYVESVGEGVVGFKKGDKVGAFHEMMAPYGSYGEYAIAWEHTTFHLTGKTSFEEAATIPLAAMTAGLGLFQKLNLPLPWNPTSEPLPLVIYGGATAVGAFAIKFATLSNIHPLIVVAGKGASFVEGLIDRSRGDTIVDYREGDDAVRSKIKAAAGNNPIHHAYDAVSEHGSYLNISAVLTTPATITTVLPAKESDEIPAGIKIDRTMVGSVHMDPAAGKTIEDREFGAAFFQFIGRGLAQGWFSGHPFEVRPGGLNGLEGALRDLENGKASAVKYVVRIAETDGVSQ
ncbi:quinone oxidoreductase [Penicillium brasilianum]|uniref:Quinone oxidoreductase n=1 Tax=Penicillium brasilianum TaxID=104259 RepID=A0A1S9RDU3_PENBI|nr:quinone oxidoreductase [Penicillium brasilianum]